MVKFLTRAGKQTGRYLVLASLTATLVACGGGSGDTVPIDDQDLDGDEIPNGEDDDDDDDGILDIVDPFVDRDGDGLDDDTGLPEEIPEEFTPVSDSAPCGSMSGTDNDSSNANWNDNCLIQRSIVDGEGQFADSLYSAGVQRIVYCAGFGSGASYTNFADGEYGEGSEAAMKLFQASSPNPITDDGDVGPSTWAKLQDSIKRLESGTYVEGSDGITRAQDAWGFNEEYWGINEGEGRCGNTVLFYQEMTLVAVDQPASEGGWRLAKNAPNTAQSVPFSIGSPFGDVLD